MKLKSTLFSTLLITALLLAACAGGAAVTASTDPMVEKTAEAGMEEMDTEEAMPDETPSGEMLESTSGEHTSTTDPAATEEMMEEGMPDAMPEKATPEAMMEDSTAMAGWFSAPLTDVRSGEQFTIGDLKGKVVLVETLAMWCSNCLKQQKQVLELHNLLGEREDFVSLGLDIDPNEVGEALQAYTEKNGFHWKYAVSPAEVSREIGQLYGDQFLNPPSTPMLIIDRHGQAHPLPFGIKDAQSLMEALQPFLEESM